jgi:hypothetical protein
MLIVPSLRSMVSLAAALALLAPAGLTAATPLPAWLSGTWSREYGAEWAEEVWLPPRDGQMLGLARKGFGPGVSAWEYLRIERGRDGEPLLAIHKTGGAGLVYPLAVASEAAIEFANPAAPFPQRIRFAREGQLLAVEMSRMDGTEAERFNFRPVATGTD